MVGYECVSEGIAPVFVGMVINLSCNMFARFEITFDILYRLWR